MRRATAALTLTVALGFAAAAVAEDEPASPWYTRLFAGTPKVEAKQEITPEESPPVLARAERVRRASAALQRRRDVCQALRELADKLDDEDLRRKAAQLDQHAWDAYVAATNAPRPNTLKSTKEKQ